MDFEVGASSATEKGKAVCFDAARVASAVMSASRNFGRTWIYWPLPGNLQSFCSLCAGKKMYLPHRFESEHFDVNGWSTGHSRRNRTISELCWCAERCEVIKTGTRTDYFAGSSKIVDVAVSSRAATSGLLSGFEPKPAARRVHREFHWHFVVKVSSCTKLTGLPFLPATIQMSFI